MAQIAFEDISFERKEDVVKGTFLRMFSFSLRREDLERIGEYSVSPAGIFFPEITQDRAERKFNQLLFSAFSNLANKLNGKRTIYLHFHSGIPLLGNGGFGIIDRGTNLIELKPISSCNIKCIYCSVDEDQRNVDVVIEKDYLIQELRKVIEEKRISGIECQITSQGEPTLYSPLAELIRGIKNIPGVSRISIITNGVLLAKSTVDKLCDAGLTRVNLSINAIDKAIAKRIAGTQYDIERVKDIAGYLAKKVDLIICPVLVPGMNDGEMPKIIAFAEGIGADIGIQNFLPYRFGRNPVKPMEFPSFYEKLREWQKDTKLKLIKTKEDFGIVEAKELPKPFRKGEVIEAEIAFPGRFPREMIAVAQERTISVPNCSKTGKVRLKITRTKHNIFIGALA
ncbi:radical SAM protein [Candidatus Woesearchaeota archaeon]|nr:radical SAM protein [Candidatus Woesearchaeota archaeon]